MRLRKSIFFPLVAITTFYSGILSAGGLTAAQVQSAYIFQISKFVSWPAKRMEGEDFNICFFPENNLELMLNQMEGRRIQQKKVHVMEVTGSYNNCHVLFIGEDVPLHSRTLIKNADENSILTVGNSQKMLTYCMLTLPLMDNKVELQVNLNLLNDANLHMSTNLLEIASKVIKEDTP